MIFEKLTLTSQDVIKTNHTISDTLITTTVLYRLKMSILKRRIQEMKKIYLAGSLFNAGERLHNLYLEKHLISLGYEVILPQREALKHFTDQHFDIQGVVAECQKFCSDPAIVFVGNVDGADADSGTCVEYAIAISLTGRAILFRTDFRTDTSREIGVNGMLNIQGTIFIYDPCYFTELDQIESYYRELAKKIHNAISTCER